MADAPSIIFNKKATDKLRNPDDLDKFIRVTNPNVWVVIAACVALLLGLLAWGIFGTVATSVSATGVEINESTMCFLSAEDTAKVHEGDIANVDGQQLKVSNVATIPISRQEAQAILGNDYLVSTLMQGDWSYPITFEGDTSKITAGVPVTVLITTERIAPISLIMGEKK